MDLSDIYETLIVYLELYYNIYEFLKIDSEKLLNFDMPEMYLWTF